MIGNLAKHGESRLAVCVTLLVLAALPVRADDHEKLNDIYRQFFMPRVNVEKVADSYADDVIHVGRQNTALLHGKPAFLAANIAPFAEMVNSGQIEFQGKAFVVRRIMSDDMANDVGYLYSVIRTPDGEPQEQLQKFSWVFRKVNGSWKVVSDFDATLAPLETLNSISAEFEIE